MCIRDRAYFEDLSVVCIVEFTGHLLSDRDTTSSTGMGAEVNGNNQWEWEGNKNKTSLNMGLGMGMKMNHWEWEGMGVKKIFPLISSRDRIKTFRRRRHHHHIIIIVITRRSLLGKGLDVGARWLSSQTPKHLHFSDFP